MTRASGCLLPGGQGSGRSVSRGETQETPLIPTFRIVNPGFAR